jgi:hypothetical protein
MKIIRIVINNEAYIDIQADEGLNWMHYCTQTRNAGGLWTPDVFVPYAQIQAMFYFTRGETSNFETRGMTMQ